MANRYYRNRDREFGREQNDRYEGRDRGYRSRSDYPDRTSSVSGWDHTDRTGGERYFGGGMDTGEGYDPGFEGGFENRDFGGERSPNYDRYTGRRTGRTSRQMDDPYGSRRPSYGSRPARRFNSDDTGGYGYYGYHGERYGDRYLGSEEGFQTDREGYDERGWWDRTVDEVSSWFGDEDAERRRRMDEREGYSARGKYRGKGPKNYTRSDSRIQEDISERLYDNDYIDASDIELTVKEGDVILTGTVADRFCKRLAEDIAEDVSGVKNVENRLRIDTASHQQQTTSTGSFAAGGSR